MSSRTKYLSFGDRPVKIPVSTALAGLRAYPNNRVVMRPSEKFEAKAAGQNPRRRSQSYVEDDFDPVTQASGFAAGRNRAGYSDRL